MSSESSSENIGDSYRVHGFSCHVLVGFRANFPPADAVNKHDHGYFLHSGKLITMQDQAFIGRQPILDAKQQIIAYELLFRSGIDAHDAVIQDNLQACARVLVNTMSDMGTQWLLGDKLAFVNVSEELLHSEFLELLPPQRMVLELMDTVKPTTQVVERLQQLRAQGFQIALDSYVYSPETAAFLQFAQYIKIDIQKHGMENASKLFAQVKALSAKIIALKVETQEEYEACKKLGFHYFQGYL